MNFMCTSYFNYKNTNYLKLREFMSFSLYRVFLVFKQKPLSVNVTNSSCYFAIRNFPELQLI